MKTFHTMLGAQHPTEESWLVYVKFWGLLLFVFVSGGVRGLLPLYSRITSKGPKVLCTIQAIK